MFLAHAPISYLANESIQRKKIATLKNSQQIFIAILSLICGILPDFDFLILMIFDRPSYTHHDCFTHTPIYWIAIWLILTVFLKIIYPRLNRKTQQYFSKDLVKISLNTFLIAGLSHFAADLLVGNIMIFYPITDTPFTIFRYIFEPSYFTGYFASVYFAIEIVVIAVFFLIFSRKFLKKHTWDNIVSYTLTALSTLYLGFSIFINFQTYNNSFLSDSNKPYIDYDTDYDTLRDTEDWDIDNNGIDNILDADHTQVVNNAEGIIGSHKITVGDIESFKDKILLKYGALNSYRLVSQAFYESFSPIEPVLKNFYMNNLEERKYSVNFNHQEVLKDYLSSKDLLIDFNLESNSTFAEGKIFFLIDKDNEIINMGITLESNNVGIVLPEEENIQNHTLDEILRFYKDTISTFQILR